MPSPVSDYASNAPENLVHAAEAVGASNIRRKVFAAIYRGKKRTKSVSDLIQATNLDRKRVLTAGKYLADKLVVNQDRQAGETVYHKIDFIHRHKKQILSLAGSSGKRNAVPTKRNPRRSATMPVPSEVRVVIRTKEIGGRVRQITVDEIDSLGLVSKIRSAGYLGDALSEDQIKEGFRRILGERGQFRDWGGEQHDLYTTLLRVGGKRRSTAIAFKGPGVKGKLTPKKMGKNGDQIQRLMESPAEVFLIQYGGQIDPSVVTQMQQLAIARSLAGGVILFGVIDGADSLRLVKAYSAKFRSGSKQRK